MTISYANTLKRDSAYNECKLEQKQRHSEAHVCHICRYSCKKPDSLEIIKKLKMPNIN